MEDFLASFNTRGIEATNTLPTNLTLLTFPNLVPFLAEEYVVFGTSEQA